MKVISAQGRSRLMCSSPLVSALLSVFLFAAGVTAGPGKEPVLGAPAVLKTADGKPLSQPLERCASVSAGDLNGDGVPDLIYAYAYPGCYDVFVFCGGKR